MVIYTCTSFSGVKVPKQAFYKRVSRKKRLGDKCAEKLNESRCKKKMGGVSRKRGAVWEGVRVP